MPIGRVIVAVGAIIEDEGGRILFVKHRPERGGFWQGRWIFPGGKLNPGETIVEGTHREVLEETNLEIELTRPNPLAERIVMEGIAVSLHVLYITHMAIKRGGDLRPASDVGEATWVRRDELSRIWPELHEDTQIIARLARIA